MCRGRRGLARAARVSGSAHKEEGPPLELSADALPLPIVLVSETGNVLGLNRAAVRLFGNAEAARGESVHGLMPFVETPSEAAARADGPSHWDGSVADPRGGHQSLEVVLAQVGADTWAYVLHDVSRFAELSQLREQLLYSLAHELRTPLSVLENSLSLLETNFATLTAEEFGQMIGAAQRTVGRLHRLMEGLLNAGSIQAGRFRVNPEPLEVATIVEDAVGGAGPVVTGRQQVVRVKSAPPGTRVLADARLAVQVLGNLLDNASKYSPEGSEIRVAVERQQQQKLVRLAVADRGRGIPAEQQRGLFERFYRIADGSAQPGVGLGLAIARGVVEAHGGSIGVDSKPGAGTTVWFTLPLATDA